MNKKDNPILLLRTSNDFITENALRYCLQNSENVICLIQSSQFEAYKNKYPETSFIDSGAESFYDLSNEIIQKLSAEKYSMIVIPTTGVKAHNFGNIIEITRLLYHDKLVFYHSDNQIQVINKMSKIKSMLYKIYIKIIECSEQ